MTPNRSTPARGPRRLALLAAPLLLGFFTAPSCAQEPSPHAEPAEEAAAVPAGESVIERAAQSRTKGANEAPITIVEISDFQCPFCRQFTETTYAALDSAYVQTGKAKLVFHNFPLPSHPVAWAAAEAALCAGAQGAFWPMHDLLFARQEEWSRADRPSERFEAYAQDLGLDADAFRTCTAEDQVSTILVGDVMNVSRAGVGATPTFILIGPPGPDGQPRQSVLSGAQPLESFQTAIEEMLEG